MGTKAGLKVVFYASGAMVMAFAFLLLGYKIPREQFFAALPVFALLVFCYLFLSFSEKFRIRQLRVVFILGLFFRLIFLFSEPTWSDDYNRFLWDGHLLNEGTEVYDYSPREIMERDSLRFEGDRMLFERLNSPDYYSVYPPVNQLFFSAAVFLGWDHSSEMIMLRIFILIGEILIFFLLIIWLNKLGKDPSLVSWYFLHPNVVLELSGNLHFEGWMMVFLLFSMLLLSKLRLHASALVFALAVGLKFLPLLFLPLLKRILSYRQIIVYSALVFIALLFFFLPLAGEKFNLQTSLGLFFQRFEFNASLHYLIREAGKLLSGFNPLSYSGPFLMFLLAVFTIVLSLRKRTITFSELFTAMTFCLLVFYLFSSIVHPWYLINLLILTLLAGFRFGFIWTLSGFLSYSFYAEGENYYYLFVAMEYIILFSMLLIERNVIRERFRSLISD